MATANQPLPVIPLEYAKPSTLPRRRAWVIAAYVALATAALDVLVGVLLIALINAETVLATAPILFACGFTLIITGRRLRLLLVSLLGLSHCAVCLLFSMLVNVRNWSPNEATMPFTIMGGAYLVGVALPVSAVAFLRVRRVAGNMAASTNGP
jgi:hypothetical protein